MDEYELIRLLLSDPEKGTEALTKSYAGLVYKIINHRLGSFLSQSDIEEAVSDVFFEIYSSREKINPDKGSLTSFVITVSQRRAVDVFRRKRKEIFLEEPIDEKTPLFENGEEIILKKEERSRLIAAIVSLGEPDSTIIFRKYYLGEKFSEIGERLSMSENAVSKRHRKSLEKLSIIMKGAD